MRIENIIIITIITAMFFVGWVGIIDDGNNIYGGSANTSGLQKLSVINQTYDLSIEAGNNTGRALESFGQGGLIEGADQATRGVSSYVKIFGILPSMVTNIGEFIGVPAWMVYGLISIIIIVAAVSLLRLLGIIKGGNE